MSETVELEPFPSLSTTPETATPESHEPIIGRSSPLTPFHDVKGEEGGDIFELHEDGDKPWWKTNPFFIREPVLFGTWDGVFTSCILNIFGVVIFLRTGWMVGNAGLGLSVLMIILTVTVALITTFSVSGLCNRVKMGPGGVYYVVSHVLGGRLGGVVGVLYVFGQAISISLYGIGLGEAVSLTFGWHSSWTVRGLGFLTVSSLFIIVLAGVKFVIRLQLILLAIIGISLFDFVVGSFSHTDQDAGFEGYKSKLWKANQSPDFRDETFFTIFGVFFTTATGVMAGLNMSGDLRKPKTAVPVGTAVAVTVSGLLYLFFAFVLTATCERTKLREDYLMASRVSLVGGIFIAGLFVSSCSSILGALFQAPRVFQSIARANITIGLLRPIAKGRGPNKEPTLAVVCIYIIAILFLLVGHVNDLAPIVTMFFLLTYAAVNYSYFALVMSQSDWQIAHKRLKKDTSSSRSGTHSPRRRSPSTLSRSEKEEEEVEGKPDTSTAEPASYLTDLFQFCDDDDESSTRKRPSAIREAEQLPLKPRPPFSVEYDIVTEKIHMKLKSPNGEVPIVPSPIERLIFHLVNRWASLIGALLSVLIMFLIHWGYALAVFTAACLLYIYILKANKGLPPGIADFSVFEWIKSIPDHFRSGKKKPVKQNVILPHTNSLPVSFSLVQLTQDNEDYLEREKRHRSVRALTFGSYLSTKVVTPTPNSKANAK